MLFSLSYIGTPSCQLSLAKELHNSLGVFSKTSYITIVYTNMSSSIHTQEQTITSGHSLLNTLIAT